MHTNLSRALLASALTLAASAAAAAEPGPYVSLGLGAGLRSDSDNGGRLTADFTTGEGTTIPAGTVLAAGTDLGWSTEFDTGFAWAPAVGYTFGNGFSLELEYASFDNDVDRHTGVTIGGGAIGTEDAGVLVTGSANLGTTVADLVAAGRGDATTTAWLVNAVYHFDLNSPVQPYVGAGAGWGNTEVTFRPSDTAIANADDDGFAWQVKAGLTVALTEHLDAFGEYRYLAQEDATVGLELLPATLDVETGIHGVTAGLRFRF
jgi:opacity protein-like surface antigen